MKLRKPDITGFRSFADKTTVEFPAAIVGPNGAESLPSDRSDIEMICCNKLSLCRMNPVVHLFRLVKLLFPMDSLNFAEFSY